jgi:hypothetical protein
METISNNLKHKSIVEFPTFIVILPSEFVKYPLIASLGKDTESAVMNILDSSNGDSSGDCSDNNTDVRTVRDVDVQHNCPVGPSPDDVKVDFSSSSSIPVPDVATQI